MPKIDFTPSHKQHLAWQYLTDNVTTEIGYGGAAGGGKSYLLCYWLTIMALQYPKSRWGFGRKELKTIKPIIPRMIIMIPTIFFPVIILLLI